VYGYLKKQNMITIDQKYYSKITRIPPGSVGPRPIAFASTVTDGNPNLSPFSFFNVFSANPPILVFHHQGGA
jgi:flavin reductase (DIM6/NTAB) family NADH-FMN oxidoreductase RutF